MKILLDSDERAIRLQSGEFDPADMDQQSGMMNLAAILLGFMARGYFHSRRARRKSILLICRAALKTLDSTDWGNEPDRRITAPDHGERNGQL